MRNKVFGVLLVVVLFIAACGGEEATNTPAPTSPPPTVVVTNTPEPAAEATATSDLVTVATETPAPETGGPVNTLEDVRLATIQIEAQGVFVDPEGEQTSGAGSGSGFIIDPSGIAVTNNHVVAGAALLQVWIGGEPEVYNAQILGMSECDDLAIIDLEGDGYTYLEWYDGEIQPGLDVYAAGFPLGEPEYTLTRGIVSKARAKGETSWASLDAVIEHDSTINPGNSGGPLVTQDGKVVGVNYRSRPDSLQYYAIGPDEALPIIERLRAGEAVHSIGVNGEAVVFESGLSGIWASSVQAGSVADRAGLKGGDIITKIEGWDLATDGTMADYCDILRTHSPEDTLNIQVVRFATEEVWEGQLNGRELALSFSFANEGREDLGGGETAGETVTYSEYVRVEDDLEAITMEVPVEWDYVDGAPLTNDAGELIGAKLFASPTGEGVQPNVLFGAFAEEPGAFDADTMLDDFDFFGEDCAVYEGRDDYQDALYTGRYDYFSDCEDVGAVMFVVAAAPEDGSFSTILAVEALTEADLDAVDHILDTFTVIGDLPGGTGSVEPPPPPADGALFGPASGDLPHDPEDGFFTSESAGLSVTDFVAEATFLNPYSTSEGTWDIGLAFRITDEGEYRLVIFSDGEWRLLYRAAGSDSEIVSSDYLSNLDTSASGANELIVAIEDDYGLFYVNDLFVAELDLSDLVAAGDVEVATGLYEGDELPGAVTGYRNFTVWTVDAGLEILPPITQPEATPVPQPSPTSPPPPPRPSPTSPPPPPATQGCYLIENQLGVDLNITFTSRDRDWNDTFPVPANQSKEYCLDPGSYTYTIDAPPPWGGINGDLVVNAGDLFRWPIRGE